MILGDREIHGAGATYGEEEILDRKVPELPAGQRIDKVLLIKVLVGS
jgi:hypothetical protein